MSPPTLMYNHVRNLKLNHYDHASTSSLALALNSKCNLFYYVLYAI